MKPVYRYKKTILWSMMLVTAVLMWSVPVTADDTFVPVYNPTMAISRMTGEIKIDGELGDSGWRTAGRADNFAEHSPGDQTKPPVETEALITYDDENLYVAMICYDDPATIRASFCERDRIFSDDNVCILLDTYGNSAWAYEFNVNPYGIQADLLWSPNSGEDSGFDIIWESAGMVTDSGYQIELAVPFSSLRFPNKSAQVWKVDFWRNHPREIRRQYSWAAYDRSESCWPCKWGTVSGITDVQPGRGIEILPTLVGYQSGELTSDGFEDSDPDGDFSLGGKYSITSNITVEATYNPDFSQVEADAAQIDVNTDFALEFDERRPFFQEGSDLYNTIFDAVYTRSINNPEFAAKFTARLDRTSIAYMAALDDNTPLILPFEEYSQTLAAERSVSNILRVRQSIGEDSRLGILMTDRRLNEGGSGSLYGLDGNFRINKGYRFEFQTIVTRTVEADDDYLNEQFRWVDTLVDEDQLGDPSIPDSEKFDTLRFDEGNHTVRLDGEDFWGHALYLGVNREGANSYMDIGYAEKSPTYRADNGYQPSNNRRSLKGYAQYHVRFDDGVFTRITPSISGSNLWNIAGVKKIEDLSLGLEGAMRFAGSSFHANYTRESELYRGTQYDDLWMAHNCIHATPSDLIAFGANINYGHQIARAAQAIGKETRAGLWWDVKPMDRLLIENWYNYAKSVDKNSGEKYYEGFTYRTRVSYQITRELSLRVVGQYNDFSERWDMDPLLTYRLNPFSKFYIGTSFTYEGTDSSTELASRQFFMKLQYLFQS